MHIVAAIDQTPDGQRVVDRAATWAKAYQAELVLLHVVHDPVLAPALSNDVPGDVARASDSLQRMAEMADCACRVDVRKAEDLAGEIVKAAADAAYLFVGSQGKSAFERMRLGSVATKVLRHSTVPLVACPHDAK